MIRKSCRGAFAAALTLGVFAFPGMSWAQEGDADRGQQAFQQCTACHSLDAGENRMGPSLAGVFGKEVGSVEGYDYSVALSKVDFAWTEENLDEWLADPDAMLPRNRMTFPGVADARARADIIAYLRRISQDQ